MGDVLLAYDVACLGALLSPLLFQGGQLLSQPMALIAELDAALVVGLVPLQRADADDFLELAGDRLQ